VSTDFFNSGPFIYGLKPFWIQFVFTETLDYKIADFVYNYVA
jgi:hypothetical protein